MKKSSAQRTLREPITLEAIGQHSGKPCRLGIKPAPVDTGIVVNGLPLKLENVRATAGFTSMGNLLTVEHMLSCLHGLGITNAIIESGSMETPIMDGSSLPLAQLIKSVGQDAPRKVLYVKKPVEFEDKSARVRLLPSDGPVYSVEIDYSDTPAIGREKMEFALTPEAYMKEIAPARTFARMKDVEFLHSQGKALGASLATGIGVEGDRILNPEGLRLKDEFVRHKILDAIGDMFTTGFPLVGRYESEKGGHFHNHELLLKLMASPDNYEIAEG